MWTNEGVIQQRLDEALPFEETVIDAGAVRFRRMQFTALAVVIGASVILTDTIFQALVTARMAGEIASLLISRMAVPVFYVMPMTSRSGSFNVVSKWRSMEPYSDFTLAC